MGSAEAVYKFGPFLGLRISGSRSSRVCLFSGNLKSPQNLRCPLFIPRLLMYRVLFAAAAMLTATQMHVLIVRMVDFRAEPRWSPVELVADSKEKQEAMPHARSVPPAYGAA